MEQETTKRESKNSVFVSLFEDKQYVFQLYKELHPEDTTVTMQDVIVRTIESVLVNTIYNDLGFLVRDKFIVLVEAQSSWNPNMTLRMMFYLAETYRRYLADSEQSEHSGTRVKLPKPDLYIVYSGDQAVPETVSFSEDYFDGDSPVDLKVKVLKEVNQTIYGQYIGFCKVFDEMRKIHKDKTECAKETIRISIERGYLAAYLKSHESEAITMMAELFNEEHLREQYNRSRDREMLNQGRAEGKAENKIEIALRMLADGSLSFDKIAALADLPLEQIQALANQSRPTV